MKSNNVSKLSTNSGQALVENVLIIPILVVIIVMIFWFARLMLTKQQLVMAARYGTDLIAYSNMDKNQIKQEIKDYLCGEDVVGRRLDTAKLILRDENIVINKCDKVDSFNMWKPMDYSPSSIEIYYEYETPKLFSAWSSYIGGDNIIKKLRIGARSEVLAGTGCKGDS